MAAQTCVSAQTATLSSSTADSVTFSGTGNRLRITAHDNALYVRFDGTTAVAAADNTHFVNGGETREFFIGLGKVCTLVNASSDTLYTAELV